MPFQERKDICDKAFVSVLALKAQLIQNGMAAPVIIAGGSHTFPVHCQRKDVECSPGTFVYWDQNNIRHCPEQPFLPAVLLVARIISLPAPGKICIDLGHKSVAAEKEITNRVTFLNAPGFTAVSQSEEHLVVSVTEPHQWQPGDVLYGLPSHICPTVALYESMTVIENGFTNGQWTNVARNRMISV
jgi:D-serine deaminase-like pyridoxal phosphate-dependent protein